MIVPHPCLRHDPAVVRRTHELRVLLAAAVGRLDVAVYELAAGVLAYRLRALAIPEVHPAAMRHWLAVPPDARDEEDDRANVEAARVFETVNGPGQAAAAVQGRPHRKGLVNGVVVMGFGRGAFCFNFFLFVPLRLIPFVLL